MVLSYFDIALLFIHLKTNSLVIIVMAIRKVKTSYKLPWRFRIPTCKTVI